MKKIVVVMPAYNAAKTIESVFKRIPKSTLKKINRFIVVNDGSKDNTAQVVKKLSKTYPITLITHDPNRGYGAAQKSGFQKAVELDADIAVLLHSDGQYAPEVLHKLIRPLEEDRVDLVLGSRILGKQALKGGMPLYKFLGNIGLTFIENICYGLWISEYHSGYMLYSKKTLNTVPFKKLSDKFHFDGEMVLVSKKMGLRLEEVPIPTSYAEEKSYLNPFTYSLEIFKTIWKFWTGKYNFKRKNIK